MQPKANLSEFRWGEKVFRVTDRVMTEEPVSDLLCSNFIELGFGYQVEGMWSEMLFNRSFEKSFQLTPATYDWFGGRHLTGKDWRGEEWYHSVYEHNRWYACPAQDTPQAIAPDSSYLVEHALSLIHICLRFPAYIRRRLPEQVCPSGQQECPGWRDPKAD